MNRIENKFAGLRKQGKKAFIAFITAGYPSLKVTEGLILEFERAGVDIVELGVPFTDPMADGPVIQESSQEALKKGVRLKGILEMVRKTRKRSDIPVCLMTYYNPVFCFGEERFISKAKACGVDGVIIPDLPPEEGRSLIKRANKAGIDIICFLSPTSSLQRVKFISRVSRGFIYYVSLTGVTGLRAVLPKGLLESVKKIKRYSKRPVCVGFGISSRLQVKRVSRIADGVIVGSAIVKAIKENMGEPDLIKRVGNFVKGLKA